jgi:predicted GNAT family N-acyltransferase
MRPETNDIMITIEKYSITDRPDLAAQGNAIRRKVFIDEQQVDPVLEYEYEEEAVHYLVIDNGLTVATARWRDTGKGIKLERFATLREMRGKGYGALILKRVLGDVEPLGKKIYLHAQISALDFYEKYGFVKEGEMFVEADIEHYMMVLR